MEGVSNLSMVQSAIERPYSGYHRPVARKAAALVESVARNVESVARNHGFADGNKRTALILMHALLRKSGYELVPVPGETLDAAAEKMVLDVVTHDIGYDLLVEWFKTRILKRP